MSFLAKLFKKNSKEETPPMPSWETVVEMMYDKHLDAFSGEVVKVIYSKDRSMRYVILKDEKDFFTYQLEAIYQYDEDEWKYICLHDNALPAMWEPPRPKVMAITSPGAKRARKITTIGVPINIAMARKIR